MSILLKDKNSERRSYERREVSLPGRLVLPEATFPCVVLDLSLGGARVKLSAPLDSKQRVRLEFDQGPTLAAEMVWLGIGMVGIRFDDDPAEIGRILSALLEPPSDEAAEPPSPTGGEGPEIEARPPA